jgi:UDP-N-acetyl-D-mannosaminuronic acid dehydrogenase
VNDKTICVIGLGYIGLPTAAMFATHGARVIGVDVNEGVLSVLNSGDVHIEETGLRMLVRDAMQSGNLVVRREPEPADAFIIAVPTPFHKDKTADLRAVTNAAESVIPHVRKGNIVILESTSPPGTTMRLVKPILERSGLVAGKDFSLAYSPERVLPGQILKELTENARVIGGIDTRSAEASRDLYAAFVTGEIRLTDATTAEMAKLMENTFRDVNIALANEFSLIAETVGIDVWEAIEIANRHPRVRILRPGPGVGGHCIAVDPWFLVEAAPREARLIRQARLVNDSMPHHVADLVMRAAGTERSPTVACLGLTYKADVDDTRESPAVEVVELLVSRGAFPKVYDPHVKAWQAKGTYQAQSIEDAIRDADAALILVEHAEFLAMNAEAFKGMRGRTIIDTRACIAPDALRNAGFSVVLLGSSR